MEKTMFLLSKALFTARPPKVSNLLSDMKATEAEYFNGRHQTLRLLDNATAASLEVAPATSYHFMMSTLLAKIEQGTFGDRDRHFSAFEIPITRSGVGACKPVALDKYLNGGILGSSSSSFRPSSKIERNANRSTHSGLLMK